MSLEVEDLCFAFSRKPVLDCISLSGLRRGTLVALVGPNATGKSTFFKCIAGLLTPQSGTIRLDGKALVHTRRRGWQRRVCFMPQNFSCNAALSVFDTVLIARKNLGGWRISTDDICAVAGALERLGIDNLAQVNVGDISGGQQQMVSLAQTLVRDPSLFVLDEPTSALDLRHQIDIMSVIKQTCKRRNILTIVALHDLGLAARFADHLLLMRKGQLISQGCPSDILTSPELSQTYGVVVELLQGRSGAAGVAVSKIEN